MKGFIMAILPIVVLLWIALGFVHGFIPTTIIFLAVFVIIAFEAWWAKYCAEHFSD